MRAVFEHAPQIFAGFGRDVGFCGFHFLGRNPHQVCNFVYRQRNRGCSVKND